MQCISLENVNFDSNSQAALAELRRKEKLFGLLKFALPVGTMANIFLGNGAGKSAYNISQTDFETFAKAMFSLPPIHKKVVRDIARMQAISLTGKQSQFWRGIADGCGLQ